jgi:hypothetical protein
MNLNKKSGVGGTLNPPSFCAAKCIVDVYNLMCRICLCNPPNGLKLKTDTKRSRDALKYISLTYN